MRSYSSSIAALALTLVAPALTQTFSDCNPMQKTDCPTKAGLNAEEYFIDFTTTTSTPADWKVTSNTTIEYGTEGAIFSIKAAGEGPTMMTDWYIFGGYVEVVMKAAPGAGIVSSFVLESDTLDEIDWEMIGSDTTQVQSNYFGKGNTTTYDRGQFHPVPPPQQTMIKYAVDWKVNSTTTWLINDQVVRTLNFADAVGGTNYPQTPSNIRLGDWIAGYPGNNQGTIEWAGGLANLSQAPFDMVVQSVRVKNYAPAASYKYMDQSGSFQSVQASQDAPGAGTVGTGSSSFSSNSSAVANQESSSAGASQPTITIKTSGYGGGFAQATNLSGGKTFVSGGTTYTISAGRTRPSGGAGAGANSNPFPDAQGASNGTQPTVTIKTGGVGGSGGAQATSLMIDTSAVTGAGASMTFGLGSTATMPAGAAAAQSGGPAQVTTNASPQLKMDAFAGGLLALVLGYAAM